MTTTQHVESTRTMEAPSARTRTAKAATIEELKTLITEASIVIDIPGARSVAIQALVHARKSKSTWLGREENDLRFQLDRMLDEVAIGWRGSR